MALGYIAAYGLGKNWGGSRDAFGKGVGWVKDGIFGGNKPDPALMASLPHFEQDRNRLGQQLEGRSQFAGGEWKGLIDQLGARAGGTAPSLAEQAYRRASADTTASLGSLARGSATPGAAREAIIQQGRIGQGMASGLATARTQEQESAQNALSQALGTRDQINSNAYLQTLAAQLGLSEAQLRAMMANQQYAMGVAGQPTGFQRGLGTISQIAGGISGVS